MNKKQLSKSYDPIEFEDEIYENWERRGYFKPEANNDGKPYTIVMPPPNITGQLHLGHAFDGTLQDIIIRWKRMQGFSALWLPGTDHASIATEVKVVEKIKEDEGKTKEELGREEFLNRAWDWAVVYKKRIVDQFKKLGASCDWDRERFTMDEGCSEAVVETFVRLYGKGLVYRGNRIINWCPDCKTALSDAEVEYSEKSGNLYHLRYPLESGDKYLVVATTRPETMLGDSGVAVNPNDERYKDLIGKNVILPLMNRKIPIIADDYVDMEFGTGAVKMTPAHDPNDFEVGLRHNLDQIRVLDDSGIMNEHAGDYKGLERYEARKKVLEDLKALGLIEKIQEHVHNVGACYRCDTVVEPIISRQWFVSMEPLAKPAIDVVRDGKTKFVPERFSKIYFNWMENIKDWCISRQLWWGHRIPAYYCDDCNEVMVSKDEVTSCGKCGSGNVRQDEDVLDTWFSSALWPFSTLGWPENTEDLNKFYPNNLLVTGFDIIFFWVARMIFSGIEQMGETPFSDVYIHGLIRDAQGRKMSKSLGNGVDPLEVIEKYGADPLRFTIVTGNAAGNDIRWHDEKVIANRNFANKIWNASKFVIMNTENDVILEIADVKDDLLSMDKWILSRLNQITREVNENMEKYELGIAAQKLYDFLWNEYCDWYIELVKSRLYGDDDSKKAAQATLKHVLKTSLKLLHPFMPFITEKLFLAIQDEEETVMLSRWPEWKEDHCYNAEESEIGFVMDAIRAVRNIKAELNVPPSKKVSIFVVPFDSKIEEIIIKNESYIKNLANGSSVKAVGKDHGLENATAALIDGAEIMIPLDELVDKEKELERLNKEKDNLAKEIDRVVKKLSNEGFIKKAPEKVVEEEKAKQEKYQKMYDNVLEMIKKYEN
ncbi:valine--tRNA ligase [Alkalibacter saccharofermentans]|uniref:Valine--tRNA ligase n=1 Tax=Alkalibacter saccharofermentans DSM 14828 TaxID=1120975 RepID=A0A1M4XN84_9FIRM|nr:valine--tRNA ligase [Alkalibacter saccharofermentans]SHE94891.1 valyl-tRNA synthetase [Alkalibacter saccharofermentans DSM 14828]